MNHHDSTSEDPYELLKMFQEKFPEKTKEKVAITVYGFEHYNINIGTFRKKRHEILKAMNE